MHRLPFEQQLLILVEAGTLVGLCVRVWLAGLHRVYTFFFGYLLLVLLQIAILSLVPFDSVFYRNAWLVSEGVIVCFYILVVLELYSIILEDLRGLATVSRRYIQVALGFAILASMLLLGLEKTQSGVLTHFFFTFERAIVFSLVLFVLLLTAFLVYYPVPLKRNIIVYSIGYAVYFLAKASSIFVLNLGYYWTRIFSNVWLATSLCCLVFWLVALNRRGETKTVTLGHQWNVEDEQRLLAQLRAINTSFTRSARK